MATPAERLMTVSHLENWDPGKLESIMQSANKLSQLPLLASTERDVMARVHQEVRQHEISVVEEAKRKAKLEGKTVLDRIALDLD